MKMSIALRICFVLLLLEPCKVLSSIIVVVGDYPKRGKPMSENQNSESCISFSTNKGLATQCLIAVKMPNYQVFLGTQLPIYDEDECYSNCLANDTCIGYDWDYGNPGCFFFQKFETHPNLNINVTHYIFIRNETFCTGDFTNESWIPVMDNASTGVKDIIAVDSLRLCVEVCLETLYCKGIDWHQHNRTCWIVNETAPLEDSYGTFHYRRIRIPYMPQETKHQGYASPLSIKPAYVVLIGLGLGCILMTIVAVVVIVTRKKSNRDTFSSNDKIFHINSLGEENGDQLSEKLYFENQDTLSTEDQIKYERYDADNAVVEAEQPLDTIE